MGDIAFNISKHQAGYYATLPAANDALILTPLQASGLGTDATLKDDDTLAQVLTHATEQTTIGRKTLASITVVVNDTTDECYLDCADVTWTAATGNALGAVVICYDDDTTSGTDANQVPHVKLDFAVTPNGGDITCQINASGYKKYT